MELTEGSIESLRGRLKWSRVCVVLEQMLHALGHAHANGVLHLDVKPHNILMHGGGYKLTDFGLAQLDVAEVGSAGAGTPRYMAPEQVERRPNNYGPWTDLFALGRVAVELLWDSDRAVFVPKRFDAWIRRMISIDISERFACARDALYALSTLVEEPLLEMGSGSLISEGGSDSVTETSGFDVVETIVDSPAPRSADFPMPPIPDGWRQPEPMLDIDRKLVGLGLYGMRTVPMVGRLPERDALWRALVETATTRRAHLCVLRGASGNGKSRLAAWLCGRAEELGVATALRATYSPASGADDGLLPMCARGLRVAFHQRSELRPHVAGALELDAEREAQLVVEALLGERELGREFRHQLVHTLIVKRSALRAVIVWIDDAQWGPDALRFASDVLTHSSEIPVLFVCTVRDDVALDDPPWEHHRAAVIDVGPLDRDDHDRLIYELLGLAPDLAAAVAARTAGNPMFAVQLVGDLVYRRALTPTPRGLQLTHGASPQLPMDLFAAWISRLEPLLLSAQPSAAVALELAAVLDQRVKSDAWSAACKIAGCDVPWSLLAVLGREHLVVVDRSGWSFCHGMLRETLLMRAQHNGRLDEHHRTCAEALLRNQADPERVARHLLQGGALDKGASLALDAAERRLATGDTPRAVRLAERALTAIERLRTPADDVRRGRAWITLSRAACAEGDYGLATALVERAQQSATANGWEFVQLSARMCAAEIARNAGNYAQAAELLRVAQDQLAADPRARARCSLETVRVLRSMRGGQDEARNLAERVLEEAERHGWGLLGARAQFYLAGIDRQVGRLDDAEDNYRMARTRLREHGDRYDVAMCLNAIGDLRRFRGDFDGAFECYQRARATVSVLGSAARDNIELNMALLLLTRNEGEQAHPLVERVLATWERRAVTHMSAAARLAHAECAVLDGDWDCAVQRFASAREQIGSYVDVDDALTAERIAGRARSKGHYDLCHAAAELAADVYRGLGRGADAERVGALRDAVT